MMGNMTTTHLTPTGTRYIYRPEALKILGIADRTFNKYIQRGLVHGHRCNFDRRRMLYRLDDIEALRDMQPNR